MLSTCMRTSSALSSFTLYPPILITSHNMMQQEEFLMSDESPFVKGPPHLQNQRFRNRMTSQLLDQPTKHTHEEHSARPQSAVAAENNAARGTSAPESSSKAIATSTAGSMKTVAVPSLHSPSRASRVVGCAPLVMPLSPSRATRSLAASAAGALTVRNNAPVCDIICHMWRTYALCRRAPFDLACHYIR